MSDVMITEADVRSFRDKLDAWAATLSDGEQAILAMVAVRAFSDAGSAGDDVEGYDGKVHVHDISITKHLDTSSPRLFATADLGSLVGLRVTFPTPGTSLG